MTNKVVSFLEKAGEVIVDAATVYAGAGPLFTNLFPASQQKTVATVGNDLVGVASEIVNVEGTFAAVSQAPTGALKLQAATPRVAAIVQQALGFTKDSIQNPTLYNQGVTELTQAMVDILNSAKASAVSASAGIPAPSVTGAVPAPAATIPAALSTPAPAPAPVVASPAPAASTLPSD